MNLTPLSEDSFEEPPQVAPPEPSQPSSPPGPSQPSSLPRPSVSAQPSSPWEGPLSSSTPDKASCGSKKKNSSHRSENRTRKLREEIEELRKQLLREKRIADAFRKKVQRLNRAKHKALSYVMSGWRYFVCPVEFNNDSNRFQVDCEPSELFQLQDYALPSVLESFTGRTTVRLYPFQIHSIALSSFLHHGTLRRILRQRLQESLQDQRFCQHDPGSWWHYGPVRLPVPHGHIC
ncbi:Phosphatidate cytidylyltransferase 2 [Dissostichus eleginoides]|uniref:phosphatidate cytidylyltransferase n=1 Tax=Dissostichus eleginoides TaxID=100907 RepID=A0AAD9C1C3_DISEL|nr:Phosphatidate cytidylyltransferase 2 [Dissostichus eleginoides]